MEVPDFLIQETTGRRVQYGATKGRRQAPVLRESRPAIDQDDNDRRPHHQAHPRPQRRTHQN
jgi:hypothetical protein